MSNNNNMNRTSENDFIIFQEECRYWISKFGLNDWELFFYHVEDDSKTDRAWCHIEISSHIATFILPVLWYSLKPTEFLIRKSAFHEVVEVLFAEINFIANDRFTSQEKLDTAIHTIIRVMENTMFENDIKGRKSGEKEEKK